MDAVNQRTGEAVTAIRTRVGSLWSVPGACCGALWCAWACVWTATDRLDFVSSSLLQLISLGITAASIAQRQIFNAQFFFSFPPCTRRPVTRSFRFYGFSQAKSELLLAKYWPEDEAFLGGADGTGVRTTRPTWDEGDEPGA